MNHPPADLARLRRWQGVTVATLFVGYAGYYVCRSNLSVASPLLLAEFESAGLKREHIGDMSSLGVLFYAIGKALNGVAADHFGGRRLFLFGIFSSVVFTIMFALGPIFAGPLTGVAEGLGFSLAILFPLTMAWTANRFVQSMGWGGLVQITARWFSAGRMATVMGILSMSYLLGDALARLYLGLVIREGFGWQGVFVFAALSLALIGVACLLLLKTRPSQLGLPEPPPPPGNVFGEDSGHAPIPLLKLLGPLFSSVTFWLVCLMNMGLTLMREAFNLWNPTYLNQVVKLDPGMAGITSLIFPLAGAVSALAAGWAVDRLGGRYGLVVVPSLVGLIVVLAIMASVSLEGQPVAALVLIATVAFFLIAPYTFCSGVLAVKIGGQRGGSTAAGLIDTAGYLGATLAGSGVGRVADIWGWSVAFASLAGVAGLTLVVSGVYAWRHRVGERIVAAGPHDETI